MENPEVAIVDTPGRIMDKKKIQTIEGANMVVVPVRPTGGNIEAFTRTIALVKEHADCPMLVAVNGSNRFSAITSFMEWLEKFSAKEKLDMIMVIPNPKFLYWWKITDALLMKSNVHLRQHRLSMCYVTESVFWLVFQWKNGRQKARNWL